MSRKITNIWTIAQAPPPPPPPPAYGAGPGAPSAKDKEGMMGLLAGIFMLIGALGLIGVGAMWAAGGAMASFALGFGGLGLVCGIIPMILGVLELIGAIFAFKRTNWAFALIGALVGLNILAIIFLAIGKKEFD